MASLASFEDSNTENEPEAGRPRVASVSRKARVTRKSSKSVSVLADLDTTENANNRYFLYSFSPIFLLLRFILCLTFDHYIWFMNILDNFKFYVKVVLLNTKIMKFLRDGVKGRDKKLTISLLIHSF